MAEVAQSRPPASRGRPSGRAGRGGHSSRGAARSGNRQSSNTKDDSATALSLEEQGEIGQLKLQYKSQLETLNELFPDWTNDDLVFALQETDGDLQTTIERISEGNVSQFADVKKKTKEKSRMKKEAAVTSESLTTTSRARSRGGHESIRGSRGRGKAERGGRGGGGGRGHHSDEHAVTRPTTDVASVPTTEVPGWGSASAATAAPTSWDQPATSIDTPGGKWGSVVASDATPTTASEGQKSSLIPEGSKKSWASMLAQSKPAPAVPPPAAATAPPKPPAPDIIGRPTASETRDFSGSDVPSAALDHLHPAGQVDVDRAPSYPSSLGSSAVNLASPKDPLTEDNVEALPDESVPAPTDTVASTRDAGSVTGNLTPYSSSQSRPPMGGYATTAWKATATPGRSASYQRRMMEQREAVVMPGNHAVDRAAIQFGNMGLNGENKPLDVDEDREETQTRTLPQQSPPSQPRTALPPVPRPQQQPIAEQQSLQEGIPTPKPALGFPLSSQPPSNAAGLATSQLPPTAQANLSQAQYGRLPSNSLSQEPGAPSQKAYDTFNQQLAFSQAQQDSQGLYQTHSQTSNAGQQSQTPLGSFNQTAGDHSHQFSTEQQRTAYQNYYGGAYGQQLTSNQQDHSQPSQRSGSGFAADSGYGSGQGTTVASRMGESQNSGHTTPNPTMVSQHQMGPQTQQSQHMHQQHPGQTGQGGNYPYNNPYYGGSYYNSYMTQYPSNYYGQQGYGAPFGGKGNMYGQPHHGYGINPQASYEHSSSPANVGGFGSSGLQGRDNTLSGGLGDYGRSGSAQASQPATSSSGAFPGTLSEGFGRGSGGFGPTHQYVQQQSQGDETLKGFNETKTGPSPASGQPGRAGSAANNAAYGGNQSNFAPPQQSSFGGYPSHLNQLHGSHSSQYGGLGGLGGHQGTAQSHQAGGYGSYGSGFGNSYGSYGRGGGWGGNYGH